MRIHSEALSGAAYRLVPPPPSTAATAATQSTTASANSTHPHALNPPSTPSNHEHQSTTAAAAFDGSLGNARRRCATSIAALAPYRATLDRFASLPLPPAASVASFTDDWSGRGVTN